MKIFDMPQEVMYELEVLSKAHDSHASDEENAKNDVWVWAERGDDHNLKRLKETQQEFITNGKRTRIIEITRRVL